MKRQYYWILRAPDKRTAPQLGDRKAPKLYSTRELAEYDNRMYRENGVLGMKPMRVYIATPSEINLVREIATLTVSIQCACCGEQADVPAALMPIDDSGICRDCKEQAEMAGVEDA